MKVKKIIAGTVVGTLLMSQAIFAGTTLSFNGNAIVEEAPDVAYVNLNIQGKGETNETAKDAATKNFNHLSSLLQDNSLVNSDDITVSNFSFYQDWDYSKEARELVGYTANYEVKVVVNNLNDIDKVLDKMAESNVIEYLNVSYGLKNDDALYEKALEEAIKAAFSKADSIVDTFFNDYDYTVTEVFEGSTNFYEPIVSDTLSKAADSMDGGSSYSTPKIKTSASVTIKIEVNND